MTKNEFIERYGEEAYQRHLEQKKQYRKQHREEIKQYNQQHNQRYYQQHKDEIKQNSKQYQQQHREEKKQYNQRYYQQHKEERKEYMKQYHKQYIEQHKEEMKEYMKQYQKQWKRKYKNMFAYCIPEQIEQIENYESAKKDNFDGWHIHHRLETHNSDGKKRLVNISRTELIALDMYYNRPANELVFLTNSEHTSLHRTKQRCSKE